MRPNEIIPLNEATVEDDRLVVTRTVQARVRSCPFLILVPEHYRDDGSCRCNDPEHREMMKREWKYTDEDFREAGVL